MEETPSAGRDERVPTSGGDENTNPQSRPLQHRGNPPVGRTLMFVDSTADQARSREAIRVHVMRESHRVRRLQQGQSEPSSNVGQVHIWNAGDPCNVDTSRAFTQGHVNQVFDELTRPLEDPGEPIAGPSTSNLGLPATSQSTNVQSGTHGVLSLSEDPLTSIASRETEPLAQDQVQNVGYLVGFYLNHMAPLSHDLLPLYRNDIASYYALLAFAAMLLDAEQGNNQSLRLARLEGQAIATIQDRIKQVPSPQTYGTLMAVAILAQLEEFRGNNPIARQHWAGLKQMITSQGGLQSVWAQRQLHSALFYLDLTTCASAVTNPEQPYVISLHGATTLASLPTTQDDVSLRISPDGTTFGEVQEILKASREFIEFLLSLTMKTLHHDASIIYYRRLTVPRTVVETIDRPARRPGILEQRILKCCKMACVLYLAAILAGEHSTDAMNDFLNSLSDKLLHRMADHDVYTEELLYILLQGTGDPSFDSPERIWLVSRLMGATKRLSTQAWDRVYSKVVDFLGLTDRLGVTIHPGLPLSQEDLQRELCSEASQMINLHQPHSQA